MLTENLNLLDAKRNLQFIDFFFFFLTKMQSCLV